VVSIGKGRELKKDRYAAGLPSPGCLSADGYPDGVRARGSRAKSLFFPAQSSLQAGAFIADLLSTLLVAHLSAVAVAFFSIAT
jgi:hypothetical protein